MRRVRRSAAVGQALAASGREEPDRVVIAATAKHCQRWRDSGLKPTKAAYQHCRCHELTYPSKILRQECCP